MKMLPYPYRPEFERPGHWWLRWYEGMLRLLRLADPTPNFQYATKETAEALMMHFGALRVSEFFPGKGGPFPASMPQRQLVFRAGAGLMTIGGLTPAPRQFTVNAGMVAEPFVTKPESTPENDHKDISNYHGRFRSLAELQAWTVILEASAQNPEPEEN